VGQRGLKLLHLWRLTKTQNQKNLFHCRLEDLPSLLRLNSCLVQSMPEYCLHKDMCTCLIFAWTTCIHPAAKVLSSWHILHRCTNIFVFTAITCMPVY